jgi:hypothetical protein
MSYAKKMTLLLLMSLAICFAAEAQDAHAKFTLPQDAMWGKTAMPAGRYAISLEFGGITRAYVTSETGSKLAFVAVPEVTEVSDSCDKTSVTLMHNAGTWAVHSVCFGELQMQLTFQAEPVATAFAALPPQSEHLPGAR